MHVRQRVARVRQYQLIGYYRHHRFLRQDTSVALIEAVFLNFTSLLLVCSCVMTVHMYVTLRGYTASVKIYYLTIATESNKMQKLLAAVGFEPTPPKRLVP